MNDRSDLDTSTHGTKRCIACSELIQEEARLCPHCRSHQSRNRWAPLGTALKWIGGAAAIISLVIGMYQVNNLFQNWRERLETVQELVRAADLRGASGDYPGAWALYEEAIDLEPGSRIARKGQVDLALQWLRNVYANDKTSFTEIVNRLLPALYRGLVSSQGTKAADIYAHIGWANYLRFRDGAMGVEVEEQFRQALAIHPENVYGHAMWGFWILYQQGPLQEAKKHFSDALKDGRAVDYAQNLQLAALLGYDEFEAAVEMIRVANQIRKNGGVVRNFIRRRFFGYVYFSKLESKLEGLVDRVDSIVPADDHLATFQWLLEGMDLSWNANHTLWEARLSEEAGDLSAALKLYESLRSHPNFDGFYRIKGHIEQGIERIARARE